MTEVEGDEAPRSKRPRRLPRWAVVVVVVLGVAGLVAAGAVLLLRSRPGLTEPPRSYPQGYPRHAADYPWRRVGPRYEPLAVRIGVPRGFRELPVKSGSWGEWLRFLPMLPKGAPLRDCAGRELFGGSAAFCAGIVDLDVRSNQECADTIMRLWSEYLRWAGREDRVSFSLSEGGRIAWSDWREGIRPKESGGRLVFRRTARPDSSRAGFDAYLDAVFAWCSTDSLAKDGKPVRPGNLRIGDYFSRPGFGRKAHAVLIVDLVSDGRGRRKALVAQGAMPAQTPHVAWGSLQSAWVDIDPSRPFEIPGWRGFPWALLRRFDDA